MPTFPHKKHKRLCFPFKQRVYTTHNLTSAKLGNSGVDAHKAQRVENESICWRSGKNGHLKFTCEAKNVFFVLSANPVVTMLPPCVEQKSGRVDPKVVTDVTEMTPMTDKALEATTEIGVVIEVEERTDLPVETAVDEPQKDMTDLKVETDDDLTVMMGSTELDQSQHNRRPWDMKL